MKPELEMAWRFYSDNIGAARQHESHRNLVANLSLGLAGAALGLAYLDKELNHNDFLWAFFVFVCGILGALLSSKHYERYWFHLERAREFRARIQDGLSDLDIKSLNKKADKKTFSRFYFVGKMRLNHLWLALHLLISLLGIVMMIFIFFTT